MRDNACDLKLITDNIAVAEAIAAAGRQLGVSFRPLIKIDCGLGRAGIAPDPPELLPLAAALSAPGAALAGVPHHAGHSSHPHRIREIKQIADDMPSAACTAAGRARDTGHALPPLPAAPPPS